jgi:hypothetical protein
MGPAPAPTPSPAPAAPDPGATPLLDAALSRAKATEAASSAAASEDPELPGPLAGRLLTASLPSLALPPKTDVPVEPVAPPAPERDPAVEEATAVVPGKPPAPAADPWREGLDWLRSLARDGATDTDPETRDLWTLRGQLLGLLDDGGSPAGDDPTPLRRSVLAVLAAVANAAGDPGSPAATARIRTAVAALEDGLPLEISELQLCRKVKGFGDYEPVGEAGCRPGGAVIVYCAMTGVRYEPDGGRYRSRLASRAEIAQAGGGAPVWSTALGTADDLCQQRRRDFYVNYRVDIPDSVPPGSYELRLIQDDLVSSQSASRTVALRIAP